MFVIEPKDQQNKPVKIWLQDHSQIEEGCLKQAMNLSQLPFLKHWVCLMPDTHEGFGMPIGGVVALKDTIIPNAVGVDIGCGMAFVATNIHKSELRENTYKQLVGDIMRDIPTGFAHHKQKQCSPVLDEAAKHLGPSPKELVAEIDRGYYQLGTLGGGNHFIEIQEDEKGFLGIMIHSGSRNFGLKVASYFNQKAKDLNEEWNSPVPRSFDLAYLPTETPEGKAYIQWMNLALDFARENRQKMLEVVKGKLEKKLPHIAYHSEVNAHHNYAAQEAHFGELVWVHRKGAIRAAKGELGIIPGAMGSFSYIVEGLGNEETFQSCSHGAGRRMSRSKARQVYSAEKTILDLNHQGVVLGKTKKSDVADECRWAYKDIDFVISQELDLINPVKKLKTICVIKG
ncbi:tRNA-splicing ligase RtcB [Geosporobacter subterraneus DSM 17957]|uniref:3'-phosphate/5'-hydroxy nucleic acid ligase n=1 Tax=Geosporobacter subterraneus DSM 17957 TaxID=1121919 RepID=A0A1M6ECC4_9FIRM|nr:RtcB family protein [Geosporobacter subterraneus]SHI82960.1 tRNA-splicing ligase RtcB [Geosporobacter subterraneus DSM 17957]